MLTMRLAGVEPARPKADTGSLILRVCQFRHSRNLLQLSKFIEKTGVCQEVFYIVHFIRFYGSFLIK